MLSQTTFHRIFRASAIYDLLVSAPFALAPGVWIIWWGMGGLSAALGLKPPAPLDAHGMLFANFFGTIVTLWSLLRLKLDAAWLARWDAAGRLFFSLAMILALAHGATPLLALFLAVELAWGLIQLVPVTGRPWHQP